MSYEPEPNVEGEYDPFETEREDELLHVSGKQVLLTVLVVVLTFVCLASLVFMTLLPLLTPRAFPNLIADDAYMFARYAQHVRIYGEPIWNPGGEPTFGFTSIAYVGLVALVQSFGVVDHARSVVVSSLIAGFCAIVLLARVLLMAVDGRWTKRIIIAGTALIIILKTGVVHWPLHLHSGMDTTFAMAGLSLYLLLTYWYAKSRTCTVLACLLGVCGGFLYLIRPDLTLFSVAISLALILGAKTTIERKEAWIVAVIGGCLLLGTLFWCKIFLSSAVPLSFYVKSVGIYGPEFVQRYRPMAGVELKTFLGFYWILPVCVLAGTWIGHSARLVRRNASAIDLAVLIATVAYVLYYLFFVLQVMHYHCRFYYPILPALVVLAVRALSMCSRADGSIPHFSKRVVGIVIAIVLFVATYEATNRFPAAWKFLHAPENAAIQNTPLTTETDYFTHWTNYWPALFEVSRLPDDLVIATTEVGRAGSLNPRKKIIDLSGLNEPFIAKNGFNGDWFFEKAVPDLLYLPHPDYVRMNLEMTSDRRFAQNYDLIPAEFTGQATLRVAVRRKSPHHAELLRIFGFTPTSSMLPYSLDNPNRQLP